MGDGAGSSKLPDRWVIYEVLKSIFEAVIYLTALSLNKHRIRLIIVTVETQHPNLLAIAASPSPARLRPGLPRRVSPQLHPSGCLCTRAPDCGAARAARLLSRCPSSPRPSLVNSSLHIPENNLPRAKASSPSYQEAAPAGPVQLLQGAERTLGLDVPTLSLSWELP